MKKNISAILAVIILIACITCLTSCKVKDGSLDDVSAVLMSDSELNKIFSSVTVDISNGKAFFANIDFKDITSETLYETSTEDSCDLAELVHDKMKAAILDAGYTKISRISAIMYSSDWKNDDNHYTLSFGVGVKNKTYVDLAADVHNPIWSEEVLWGGYDEVE